MGVLGALSMYMRLGLKLEECCTQGKMHASVPGFDACQCAQPHPLSFSH